MRVITASAAERRNERRNGDGRRNVDAARRRKRERGWFLGRCVPVSTRRDARFDSPSRLSPAQVSPEQATCEGCDGGFLIGFSSGKQKRRKAVTRPEVCDENRERSTGTCGFIGNVCLHKESEDVCTQDLRYDVGGVCSVGGAGRAPR